MLERVLINMKLSKLTIATNVFHGFAICYINNVVFNQIDCISYIHC